MSNIDKDIHMLKSYAGMTHKLTDNQGRPKLDQAIENVLADRETWKKTAEFLAKRVSETGECYFISPTHCEKYSDKSCDECIVQCILEWAKSEVANDKQS